MTLWHVSFTPKRGRKQRVFGFVSFELALAAYNDALATECKSPRLYLAPFTGNVE